MSKNRKANDVKVNKTSILIQCHLCRPAVLKNMQTEKRTWTSYIFKDNSSIKNYLKNYQSNQSSKYMHIKMCWKLQANADQDAYSHTKMSAYSSSMQESAYYDTMQKSANSGTKYAILILENADLKLS